MEKDTVNKIMTLIDNDGKEVEMYILFTYKDEEKGNQYVFYMNPKDENAETYVSRYDDDGNIFEVTEESDWEMLENVFNDFMEHQEGGCSCGCEDGQCHCEDGECDCDGECEEGHHDCHCKHEDKE